MVDGGRGPAPERPPQARSKGASVCVVCARREAFLCRRHRGSSRGRGAWGVEDSASAATSRPAFPPSVNHSQRRLWKHTVQRGERLPLLSMHMRTDPKCQSEVVTRQFS